MLIQTHQLTPIQLKALKQLMARIKKQDGGLPPIHMDLIAQKRPLPCHFLYYQKQTLIGFASLYLFHTPEITLLIHPTYRQKKITRLLVGAVHVLCTKTGRSHFLCASFLSPLPNWMRVPKVSFHHHEYRMIRTLKTPEIIQHTTLQIQKATKKMIATLCDIDAACFPGQNPDMHARFNELLQNKHYLILVALYQDKIIGKVHLQLQKKETILSDLSILPAFQHQGLGLALLKQAVNQVLSQGFVRIALEIIETATLLITFYKKAGFTKIKKIGVYQYSNAN